MSHVKRGLGSGRSMFDAIIVGGGHNGLVAAAYLAKAGKNVGVLERRPVLGGAAVTEEIVKGYRFSRASYVLSLFRPVVLKDLRLQERGLRWHIKDPTSFTPMRNSKKSLVLGSDEAENSRQIAQFSAKDAEAFPRYETWLNKIVAAVEPLFDEVPVEPSKLSSSVPWFRRLTELRKLRNLGGHLRSLGASGAGDLGELLTAPIGKILDQWFESEPLKATLATDGVIGFLGSPRTPGTGYVLLHHVLGGVDGRPGAWAIVMGGMGAVSQAIADVAAEYGVDMRTNAEVQEILVSDSGRVRGVRLAGGEEISAPLVLSNATPEVTFRRLLSKDILPDDFLSKVASIDYTSPVTKINVALSSLPNFTAIPNKPDGQPMPHHQTTIHLNCEDCGILEEAYSDALAGKWSRRPIIEMTIPSSVDSSLAPKGGHVALLFTQMTPYRLAEGPWTPQLRKAYARQVFADIDAYAPGFSDSVVGYEVLTPPDIEATFGLTGGNIFHGSMSLDQLYHGRPVLGHASYTTPIPGLYLCGSGAHPGGGVSGAPGRLAALTALSEK